MNLRCNSVCTIYEYSKSIKSIASVDAANSGRSWFGNNIPSQEFMGNVSSLKLTHPLKIGRAPIWNVLLPTIHFQGRTVSFREGIPSLFQCLLKATPPGWILLPCEGSLGFGRRGRLWWKWGMREVVLICVDELILYFWSVYVLKLLYAMLSTYQKIRNISNSKYI